ncbi:hypothetical protein AVEN_202074-1 [Araneus ventricosus]|uniref:Uncharacterized protein n=1 Tax=Araneus ventricosus TaxID=182803 RepID=A0A4Y2KYC8_ARAVE|nr:hypothetical protein AVEN_202074-1 [Araneus ventricosus]
MEFGRKSRSICNAEWQMRRLPLIRAGQRWKAKFRSRGRHLKQAFYLGRMDNRHFICHLVQSMVELVSSRQQEHLQVQCYFKCSRSTLRAVFSEMNPHCSTLTVKTPFNVTVTSPELTPLAVAAIGLKR